MTNSIYCAIVANAVDKEAEKRGKSLFWFKYATKLKGGGYRFLQNKDEQWRILERLAKSLKGKLPGLTTGNIVDMIAEYVNTV